MAVVLLQQYSARARLLYLSLAARATTAVLQPVSEYDCYNSIGVLLLQHCYSAATTVLQYHYHSTPTVRPYLRTTTVPEYFSTSALFLSQYCSTTTTVITRVLRLRSNGLVHITIA
eukprot:7597013-Pyramimonas_sp.AAC.1